ncbi:hypothetical protein [Rhodohalobacter barkolensis]|uniref:Uncharacterized protein n=1 Tax=Rhodohalobacter barkolensis TaxID=2053187 RepID=A0A2N0VLM2_9BACT|nr:hypothetical protein [Rhodohalobacter barkolensis]PKD45086.1 hypothetical protein CWD77_06425 [Rhodohalobacter barkolensis]
MKAIELHSKTDENGRIKIEQETGYENKNVRVLILVDESEESVLSEAGWFASTVKSPSFDFLKDDKQNIYTLSDGELFED